MKKLPRSKKLIRQSFTCTPHEWKLIKDYAALLGVSASKFIRVMVIDQIANKGASK